jgi:hypothetical protein
VTEVAVAGAVLFALSQGEIQEETEASIRARKASTRSHISSEEARSYSGRSGSVKR